MFNVLIDTCVWLDLAQDSKQTPLLRVVESMVQDKGLALIVPRVVQDEFQRNRARVAKASARSLAGHFQQVKEAVNKSKTNARRKKALLAQLDDLNHKIPIIGGAAEGVLERVSALLRNATIRETSDEVKLRSADRALGCKAPCHHTNKNYMADAVVIEANEEREVLVKRAGATLALPNECLEQHSEVAIPQHSGDQPKLRLKPRTGCQR